MKGLDWILKVWRMKFITVFVYSPYIWPTSCWCSAFKYCRVHSTAHHSMKPEKKGTDSITSGSHQNETWKLLPHCAEEGLFHRHRESKMADCTDTLWKRASSSKVIDSFCCVTPSLFSSSLTMFANQSPWSIQRLWQYLLTLKTHWLHPNIKKASNSQKKRRWQTKSDPISYRQH